MDPMDMQANAAEAAALMKMLSNPARLLVLCALVSQEHTAGELEELVGLSQSALSQHLAKLRRENLVTTRRDGQKIHYAIADGHVQRLVETLHDIYCGDK